MSHEFRTPLTSMRHLTDLLVSRSITSEERKSQYYELLAHETVDAQRLDALVAANEPDGRETASDAPPASRASVPEPSGVNSLSGVSITSRTSKAPIQP